MNSNKYNQKTKNQQHYINKITSKKFEKQLQLNQTKKENITHSIQTIRKNKTIEHCKQQQKQPKISIIILSACV